MIADQVEHSAHILDPMVARYNREGMVLVVAHGEGRLAACQLRIAGIVAVEDQPRAAVQHG